MLLIEENTDLSMRMMAIDIQKYIGKDKYGFVVLLFPFSEGPQTANYVSNCNRKDMIAVLREKADVLERSLDIHN